MQQPSRPPTHASLPPETLLPQPAAALAARREELAREQALQAARDAQKTGGRARAVSQKPHRLGRNSAFLPGRRNCPWPPAPLQAGLVLRRIFARRPALQRAAGTGAEAPDLDHRLGTARRGHAGRKQAASAKICRHRSAATGMSARWSRAPSLESSRGGSRSTTAGVGVGTGAAGNGSYQGFNFGALLGISGGYGEANSTAWQDSARNASADSLQRLRDRTMQSASAVRSQRASVVRAVRQGEAVRRHDRSHRQPQPLPPDDRPVLRGAPPSQADAGTGQCPGMLVRSAADDHLRPGQDAALAQ